MLNEEDKYIYMSSEDDNEDVDDCDCELRYCGSCGDMCSYAEYCDYCESVHC